MTRNVRITIRLMAALAAMMILPQAQAQRNLTPPSKKVNWEQGFFKIEAARIVAGDPRLANEARLLGEILAAKSVRLDDGGVTVTLAIGPVALPEIASAYRDRIAREAYHLTVGEAGISLTGASPAAVYYGVHTLGQFVNDKGMSLKGEVTDWPDLPVRILMIDAARQNENFEYYRRFIEFAARYRINTILCHLTDDQTSALHHPDYPELMHPQAWTADQIRELVAYAAQHHVELIPEIESFGHSRMFTRRADFRDFLHQTKSDKPTMSWVGTDIAGYTNVLCPASPKASAYLDAMYGRAAETFSHPWLHIGFDEVDITDCDRCRVAFGEQTAAQWIGRQLAQCRELVHKRGKTLALWGDMILKYPEALRDLPTTNTIVFDWDYTHDVTGKSSALFKAKGYEVVACPALVCAPHMILPDWHNYENIRRFTRMAHEQDLLGVCTTIWIPPRYMSDALWPGIAFAAGMAWNVRLWDDVAFFDAFTREHFGSFKGGSFEEAWLGAAAVTWHRGEFVTSCWTDEKSLAEALKLAAEKKDDVERNMAYITSALDRIDQIADTIQKNRTDFEAFRRSVLIMQYTLKHLQAAPDVKTVAGWNLDLVRSLDQDCEQAILWIEDDWNRNRYAGDPNRDGLYLTNQHLLYQFKQMHKFHQEILATAPEGKQSE